MEVPRPHPCGPARFPAHDLVDDPVRDTQEHEDRSDPETGAEAITKWRASIDEGRARVVVDSGKVLGTVSRGPVDRHFWTDEDRPESAFHLYKLIVARQAAGRHLGARLVDWASGLAVMEGRDRVRTDTWRTNEGLHSYYERLGFRHVRTESPSHRLSGWLAQRPTTALSLPDFPLTVGPPHEGRTAPIPSQHTPAD
ncbi:GNAT family N-acetyltransferase [Streptomyces sp. NPDC058545]|uniref:GNAT family N-acetyltransferase n=1 Tax=Streptomyces sp. NPDC058545 TaxID=3346544 RepID=UPI003667B32D